MHKNKVFAGYGVTGVCVQAALFFIIRVRWYLLTYRACWQTARQSMSCFDGSFFFFVQLHFSSVLVNTYYARHPSFMFKNSYKILTCNMNKISAVQLRKPYIQSCVCAELKSARSCQRETSYCDFFFFFWREVIKIKWVGNQLCAHRVAMIASCVMHFQRMTFTERDVSTAFAWKRSVSYSRTNNVSCLDMMT